MTVIVVTRAGPLCTVQDAGRFGMLRHGVSASGPMDRGAFARAAAGMDHTGTAGIEFTTAGLSFRVEGGPIGAGFDGGAFTLTRNGESVPWPARLMLGDGDSVDITPGPAGNYGYVRFAHELAVPPVMGSRATSSIAGLGGLDGRSLRTGDRLTFGDTADQTAQPSHPRPVQSEDGPIRVLWGLHAELFPSDVRERFASESFAISSQLDRMGGRLVDSGGVFAGQAALSLVSDAIVPGDIQVLGDGTPIVLLRDHQPTGGYPRIATVISADLDRFVQLRPGSDVRFEPVTLERAHAALRGNAR